MIHLHAHTKYSIGDGLPSSKEYVAHMKQGDVLAITDHDSMSGMVDHHKACSGAGVKPIYGTEVTLAQGGHVTLLAKNNEGLVNLFRLLCLDSIEMKDLDANSGGVVCLSGDMSSPLSRSIFSRDKQEVNRTLNDFRSIYGDSFFLEEIDHNVREQAFLNAIVQKLSQKSGIPCVTTNDVHYIHPEDALTQVALMCDKYRKAIDPSGYHIPKEAWLKDIECENARMVADMCNVELDLNHPRLPSFESERSLKELVWDGMKELGLTSPEHIARAKLELQIIEAMDFNGYFLIVEDFVRFARESGIPVGPGRGSGAGSIVAYALRITDVDPMRYGLLFERFLNPERISMPDFDIDFGQHRRHEVINYVVNKYGEASVGQIATFSGLKPRAAWKSAARMMGIRPDVSDMFSSKLPDSIQSSDAVANPHKLVDIFTSDGRVDINGPKEYQEIQTDGMRDSISLARKLEGRYRSAGKHAAGVLIADGNIFEQIPMWKIGSSTCPLDEGETTYLSQLSHSDAEKMGVVKFDFLGLKELDVIEYAQRLIGHEIDFGLDFDDSAAYELISRGDTLGVFQVSSEGLSMFCELLQPECFEDVVAVVALYRPGPKDVGMHLEYVKRKHGEVPVVYLHDDLKESLGETYGVIVYQEQVMAIVQKMAGYSLGEADILRRAMGKKKFDEMESQHKRFLSEGASAGYSKHVLKEVWSQIETFARYGFNKSHSVAYAILTYKTAYLKAHYRAEFLAAQMQIRKDDFDSISLFSRDGCVVNNPDIRSGRKKYHVKDGEIWAGIGTIKGLGEEDANRIEANGPYRNLDDFMKRIQPGHHLIKCLTLSGALDSILPPGDVHQVRADAMVQLGSISKMYKNGQLILFDMGVEVGKAKPFGRRELLDMEYHYLGRYRSGHPVPRDIADRWKCHRVSDVTEMYASYRVMVLVRGIKTILSKKGDPMCFLNLEDETGNLDVTVFPSDYENLDLEEGEVVVINIETQDYQGNFSAIFTEASRPLNPDGTVAGTPSHSNGQPVSDP